MTNDDQSTEMRYRLKKTVEAIVDLLILLVGACVHKGALLIFHWIMPTGWERSEYMLHVMFAAAFWLIYLHFCWQLVCLFIPELRNLVTIPVRAIGAYSKSLGTRKTGGLE